MVVVNVAELLQALAEPYASDFTIAELSTDCLECCQTVTSSSEL